MAQTVDLYLLDGHEIGNALYCSYNYEQAPLYDITLFPKRNATLISRFFMVTLDQGSLTYTPPQKKGNFRKVAFLLGKSVCIVYSCLGIFC